MKTPKRIEPLVEDGLVDEVLRPLMSGKEAAVYVVRCGDELRCAKVYKEANKRSFRQAAEYQEGRKVRGSRQARAMAKGSKYGRKEQEQAWQNAEVAALFRLAAADVRVPKPYDFLDGVLHAGHRARQTIKRRVHRGQHLGGQVGLAQDFLCQRVGTGAVHEIARQQLERGGRWARQSQQTLAQGGHPLGRQLKALHPPELRQRFWDDPLFGHKRGRCRPLWGARGWAFGGWRCAGRRIDGLVPANQQPPNKHGHGQHGQRDPKSGHGSTESRKENRKGCKGAVEAIALWQQRGAPESTGQR